MNAKSSIRNIDGIILFFAVLLANLRASIFIHLDADTSNLLGPAWIEIALWFLTLLAVVYTLARNDQLGEYLVMIRRNWLIILFILLAFASMFWSVDPVATAFRALELLLATLIAVYIGMCYRLPELMELLFWFGAIMLMFSIAMVFASPKAGTMYWPPFDGAWRGFFWHRNHLGSLTALVSIVFLCRAIFAFENKNGRGILDALFYFVALVVLFFANSATGYILYIFLNFLVVCIWLWLKAHQYLRARHYYAILGAFVAGLAIMVSNLDAILGLFNRNTTLTGRVGLWDDLLTYMVARRPWWGHGFGAVWTIDSFREEIRQYVGWASQPLIGDNGYLDILLHLGIIGLALLIVILVVAGVQSFRYAISRKQLEDFFPLLFLSYFLIANIPFSLIAETEVFIWLLMVTVRSITMPSSSLRSEIGGTWPQSPTALKVPCS